MTAKLILFFIIHLAALVYFVEMLRRMAIKSREYELKENRQSMPFGFIRLRHIVLLYVFCYLAWIVGSVFLYLYFIEGSLVLNGVVERAEGLNL